MIKKIDHVALAVQNAGEVSALLSKLFGFEVTDTLEEPEAGFISTMVSTAGVRLELLQPAGPHGMIQKFMEKRGGGLHHISLQVDDLDREMKRLKALGVQFVSEEPMQMEDASLVFVHPKSTGGLLIELAQKK
ncbi:MAG: methylmalonyl-CoA epimerase [Acidobacteria bacterium]|jgi:methylmalonyl-CoA epimerase|nr:methylmalonyl-CoA epimerase [Acidobacteriota bacterium]